MLPNFRWTVLDNASHLYLLLVWRKISYSIAVAKWPIRLFHIGRWVLIRSDSNRFFLFIYISDTWLDDSTGHMLQGCHGGRVAKLTLYRLLILPRLWLNVHNAGCVTCSLGIIITRHNSSTTWLICIFLLLEFWLRVIWCENEVLNGQLRP